MRRILIPTFLLPLALAGCALLGRGALAPHATAPSMVNVAALTKFDGRLPLVTIPGSANGWAPSVKYAVDAALKINRNAAFRVYITAPAAAIPSVTEQQMAPLASKAAAVADAIVADGVAPGNVSLGASTNLPHVPAPAAPEIVVFAK